MKILVAVNGSASSNAAIEEIIKRLWPVGSELRIIAIAEIPIMPVVGSWGAMPELATLWLCEQLEQLALENARAAVIMALLEFDRGDESVASVTTEIIKGSPVPCIINEGERWGADLIIVGSGGERVWDWSYRGDTAMAVAKHAKCSVEIVKCVKGSNKASCLPAKLIDKEVSNGPTYSY